MKEITDAEFEEEVNKKDDKEKKVGFFRTIFLKLFCLHSWYKYGEVLVCDKGAEIPHERRHTLICEKCGKIKKITL